MTKAVTLAGLGSTNPNLTAPIVDSLNGGQLAGLRNKIINGNMDIAQRGAAAVTTHNVYGPADRWVSSNLGNTFSTTIAEFVSGDTLYDTGGARYYTTIAVTSVAGAGNYTHCLQPIENVRILAGQTVTVSFWAKAASGTPLIGVEVLQSFGSGGSPSALGTGVGQSVTLSTTWTKYTRTISVGSLSGKTVGTDANSSSTYLIFWLDSGANFNTRSGTIGQASKTVSIAQVQLEIGSVATPFEQRPYGMELALCQRYYWQQSNVIFTTGFYRASTTSLENNKKILPVPMRITPNCTAASPTGTGYTNGSSVTLTSISSAAADDNTQINLAIVTSASTQGLSGWFNLTSTLTASAEI